MYFFNFNIKFIVFNWTNQTFGYNCFNFCYLEKRKIKIDFNK